MKGALCNQEWREENKEREEKARGLRFQRSDGEGGEG